ncbi:MAG: amidohydrolase family protein [Acidimicrobiales bacterium]
MAYIEGRVVHDADAHIMETPDWVRQHADPSIRELIKLPGYTNELRQTGDNDEQLANIAAAFDKIVQKHRSDEYRAKFDEEVMHLKNFAGPGTFIAEDRPAVLDAIGVSSQLVFNTFHNRALRDWEHSENLELAYGGARAHNRAMAEFCGVDRRLLSTLYVPLADFDLAAEMAGECIEMGAGALLIQSGCPAGHSPSHRGLDRVWAQAQEAGIPVVFHVGGTDDLLDANYFNNGLPIPPDFHGGDENFRSVDYMAIPHQIETTLATLIFDGVLERFPNLKWGVIEQGCSWVPSWIKYMESAFEAFHRHEDRLQALSLRPTEYVERQVRVTPYPTEDVGWVTDQIGPDILMFNTDYPHVEGGRRPYERFEKSLGDRSEEIREKFYSLNMLDLMGNALAPVG